MATDKRLDQVSQLTDFDYALIVKGDQVAKASKQQLAELVGNLLYGATNASSLATVVAEQNGFYIWSSKLDVGATTTVELNAGQIFIHAPALQYAESAYVDYWGDTISTIAGNVRKILKFTKGAKSKTVTIENIYNIAVRFYIFSLNFK